VTEIENFQKLTHLNQFSRQKHTHARVWVILPQLPGTWGNRAGVLAKTSFFTECDSGVFRSILIYFDHFDLFRSILILASKSSKHFDRAPAILICFNVCTRLKSQK
jgi:hypothetical protein